MFPRPGKPVRNCGFTPQRSEECGLWRPLISCINSRPIVVVYGLLSATALGAVDFTKMDGKYWCDADFFCFYAEFHADFTVIVWLHGEFMQNLWSLIVDFRTYYGEQVFFGVENTTSMKIGMYTINGFTVNRKTSFFALIGWWMLMGRRLIKVSVMEEQVSRWNYQSYTKTGTSLLFYLPKQHRYHLQQSQEWIVYTLGFKCTLPIILRLFLGSQLFLWLEYIILDPDYMMIYYMITYKIMQLYIHSDRCICKHALKKQM